MIVLGKDKLAEFQNKHANLSKCTSSTLKIIEDENFQPRSPQSWRDRFRGKYNYVTRQDVIDSCQNDVRIIGRTTYLAKPIFIITHVLMHAEYNKEKWKKEFAEIKNKKKIQSKKKKPKGKK